MAIEKQTYNTNAPPTCISGSVVPSKSPGRKKNGVRLTGFFSIRKIRHAFEVLLPIEIGLRLRYDERWRPSLNHIAG
jgi:hypothetical protein